MALSLELIDTIFLWALSKQGRVDASKDFGDKPAASLDSNSHSMLVHRLEVCDSVFSVIWRNKVCIDF